MWLGMSLDVQHNGSGIIVCGSRWINQYYEGYYFLNGICYFLPHTLDEHLKAKKMMPLIQNQFQVRKGEGDKFYYSYGQAGMSVKFVKDDSEIIIGAPGISRWKGSVVIYDSKNSENTAYSVAAVPDPQDIKSIPENSYFGYSLDTGNFFANKSVNYYVSGAPRAADNKGKIIIYSVTDGKLEVVSEQDGEIMGEYFGASVCVADLNGDGLDDILVGAPYHPPLDTGKIYVFLNNAKYGLTLDESHKISGSKEPWSHFGSAISNLGDINGDGFSDIAVGAPNEDEGRGSVYIFMGSGTSRSGLRVPSAQRITASYINPNLQNFGSSISRGYDIDGNNYNDVAVGAYSSGHVVILRANPVIKLFPYLEMPKILSVNDSFFTVNACIGFQSKHPSPMASVRVKLQILSTNVKANFEPEQLIVTYIAEVYSDKPTCKAHNVTIKVPDELPKPVYIIMDYGLVDNQDNSFCKDCPTLDPEERTQLRQAVYFPNGCERVDQCLSDLHLNASVVNKQPYLIVGTATASNVTLLLTVQNTMEPAFRAKVQVSIPSQLLLKHLPYICEENKTSISELTCDIGDPLLSGTQVVIPLILELNDDIDGNETFNINITASSEGSEQTPHDNNRLIQLPVITSADISLLGKSSHEQLIINTKNRTANFSRTAPNFFKHRFEVVNFGPSPVKNIKLEFKIPTIVAVQGSHLKLFEISEPKAYIGNKTFKCWSVGNPEFASYEGKGSQEASLWDGPYNKFLDNSSPGWQQHSRQRDDFDPAMEFPNGTHIASCKQDSNTCITVHCMINKLHPISYTATVTFTVQIIPSALLEEVLGEGRSVLVVSSGNVRIPEFVHKSMESVRSSEVLTLLLGSRPPQAVSSWIIVISALFGIFLLAAITFVLYKTGFFRRIKKEELEATAKSLIDEVNSET